MWLLRTDLSELRPFTDTALVDGGYAILSHVWDPAGEQTFQEVQAIWTKYNTWPRFLRQYVFGALTFVKCVGDIGSTESES